jgi:hypothetical protein
MTAGSMSAWAKRWHPDRYQEIADYLNQDPKSLFMDFERPLTHVEKTQGYDALMDAVRNANIRTAEHKGFLTCLLASDSCDA